ncbi:methyl-accepting chemotaxis protein [Bosea sp. (in: a-proteobacteria)]|jgi:methyl-accepting chemotaxis protein|uniref:methyl-accepting chemotaxis protein n=1 Tax=Bosea sp. (in: a-proteobacteria) TaxID=1871050 RepID=UPI003F715392
MTDVEKLRARFAYVLIAVLWANTALLALAGQITGVDNPGMLVGASVALALLATLAWWADGTKWLSRQVSSVATMGQVMLLVYAFAQHPYQADIHMYFFAMLAVLSGWLDWRIFVTATLAIAAHHGILSIVYPSGVFLNGGSVGRVLLHALIVVVQSVALGWVVISLRSALVASESERRAATDAKLVAEEARNEVAATTQQAAAERQTVLFAVADDFESKIAGIARDVISSVHTLRAASQQMRAGATQVAERSGAASLSSQHTSSNVVAVTQATTELAASIGEIDKQVGETARIVGSTTTKARTVLATVNELSKKADDVGNIVGLISTIASQTNLLALNAAIEAARFGHSGSGFAVVAQEVKALANQTSRATDDIQAQIEAIHASGEEAIRAIDAMNATIGSLNEVSAAVATVMEQQNAATAGIAYNIEVAAQETVMASENIGIVSRVAAETGDAAAYVAESADRLAEQSAQLDLEVARFLGRIRAA